MNDKTLLTRKEAAYYLGRISVETLDRYKDSGKLGYVQIGKRCLFTTALLDEFITRCTKNATNETTAREKKEILKAVEGAA